MSLKNIQIRTKEIFSLICDMQPYHTIKNKALYLFENKCRSIIGIEKELLDDGDIVEEWKAIQSTLSSKLQLARRWHLDVIRSCFPEGTFQRGGDFTSVRVKGEKQKAIIQHVEQIATEAPETEPEEVVVKRCEESIISKWQIISKDGSTEGFHQMVRTIVCMTRGQEDNKTSDVDVVALCEKFDGDDIVEVRRDNHEIDASVSSIDRLHQINQENPTLYAQYIEMQQLHLNTKSTEANNESKRIEVEKFKAGEETRQIEIRLQINHHDNATKIRLAEEERKKVEEQNAMMIRLAEEERKKADEENATKIRLAEEERRKTEIQWKITENDNAARIQVNRTELIRVELERSKFEARNNKRKDPSHSTHRVSKKPKTVDETWIEENTLPEFGKKEELSLSVQRAARNQGCILPIQDVYRLTAEFIRSKLDGNHNKFNIARIKGTEEVVHVVYISSLESKDKWISEVLAYIGANSVPSNDDPRMEDSSPRVDQPSRSLAFFNARPMSSHIHTITNGHRPTYRTVDRGCTSVQPRC